MLHISACNILCSMTSVLCIVACIPMSLIFLGFPLCVWNLCQIAFMFLNCSIDCRKPWVRIKSIQYRHYKVIGFQNLLSGVGSAKPKMLTKLVAFSARWISTFQIWEFQRCEAMLRVRSTKKELHRGKYEMLTSDTLLVTKRIPMIVVNLLLLLPLQLLKKDLPLLTWAKT